MMENNPEMSKEMMMGKMCKCPHHMMTAWAVVLFGLTFLLGATDVLSVYAVNIIWPILVILVGFGMMCKCYKHMEKM